MKKLVALLLFLICLGAAPAHANCTTPCTKAQTTTDINTNWPDNTTQLITPALLRSTVLDLVNSYTDINGASSFTCPTNQFLTAIATLSSYSCTQPAFTNISGTAAVAQGGTGLTSLTTGYMVCGAGTSPFGTISASAGTSGLALVSNGAACSSYQLLSLSGAVSGTLQAAQFPALTGDCTTTAGSLATTCLKTNGVSFTSTATSPAGSIPGLASASSATAGSIGEYVAGTQSSAQSLTNNTALTITSVSLTAGDWDCSGTIAYQFAATTTMQSVVASLSTTTNALGSLGQLNSFNFGSGNTQTPNGGFTMSTPVARFSLAATTTVFLVGQVGFGTSTVTGTATMRCRRTD